MGQVHCTTRLLLREAGPPTSLDGFFVVESRRPVLALAASRFPLAEPGVVQVEHTRLLYTSVAKSGSA